MNGLIAYGAYVPYNRLKRSEIGDVLGAGGGKGTRAVASYDEDSTTMGAEAARTALRMLPDGSRPTHVYFATASPAYMDKTNATAIHAALDLDEAAFAVDMGGSVRSGVGAIVAAKDSNASTLAIVSDVRTGLPGGADERDGGDAAAAFVFGDGSDGAPVIAEYLAGAASTAEFLDRWRLPTETVSKSWEERFGEQAYLPLAESSFAEALKRASLVPDQLDHVIVAGLHARAVRSFAASCGARKETIVDNLAAEIGNAGTAQAGVMLADVLDRAEADQTIAVVVLADGVTTLLFRTTPAISSHRSAKSVRAQIAAGNDALPYATFLSWRGMLDREPPRRPDPDPAYAPPSSRREDWKFAFVGSRCTNCGRRHLPPSRVCLGCRSVDEMERAPMSEVPATVATFTIDRLAFSPHPPVVFAVLDYDGGGRFRSQMTDIDPAEVQIGLRAEMTFRRFVTARGIHNYFWKGRPVREG